MKYFKLVLAVICLLGLLMLAACGGEEEPPCAHPGESLTITKDTAPTCLEAGLVEKQCGVCGEIVQTTIDPLGHSYEDVYDVTINADRSTCTLCGESGIKIAAGGKLRLTGYTGGDVVFTVKTAASASSLELSVDDGAAITAACSEEPLEIEAKGLDEKQHIFAFLNTGSEDVFIKEVKMDGKLNRPGSVLLEVAKSSNGLHAPFKIYIQTSDPSGDYYVCYNMGLDNNDDRYVYKADSTRNVYNYRIKEASLVKVNDITETQVICSKVIDVLQQGEKSLALKQKVTDDSILTEEARTLLAGGTEAKDFVGGYHGDERMEDVTLYADGEEVELFERKEATVIPCSVVNFEQTATIYHWGTSSSDSYGRELAFHAQSFVMDSNGIANTQSIHWLDDNLEFGSVMMLMFTMLRESGGKPVCEVVETYDIDGNFLERKVSKYPCSEDQKSHMQNVANHTAKYSSESSGISATVSFESVDDSIKTFNSYFWFRQYGDNKFYCDFASPTKGKKADSGDVWAIKTHYTIDYVKPE